MILEKEKKVDINSITGYYNSFEKNTPIKVVNKSSFDTPVNFKQAKSKPIHRWFTYKEGFSPLFVKDFITRFQTAESKVVFDPFGGIGTTVLESSLLGFNTYSNDVNPLSNYISEIKNTFYNIDDLKHIKNILNNFNSVKFSNKAIPPENKTVLNYFEEETLHLILQMQNWISKIDSNKTLNLFNLALLTNLEKISTHRKDGNGVKKKRKYAPINTENELKRIITEKVSEFIDDINVECKRATTKIYYQSSFETYSIKEKADLVITSPPYANCFDYSKVYLIELWFGGFFKRKEDQKRFRENSIISHVHYKWTPRHPKYGHALVENEIFNYRVTHLGRN
jgi:hypothetical protein